MNGKAITRAIRADLMTNAALNSLLLSKAYDLPLTDAGEIHPNTTLPKELQIVQSLCHTVFEGNQEQALKRFNSGLKNIIHGSM